MPIEPTLAEVIESAIDSRVLDLHTMIVGKVVSYDAAKQAAVVQPVVNGAAPTLDGSTTSETLPSIPNVPVRWERAGGYYDHKPLAAGDCGLLIFSESAFATWRVSGAISDPGDISRHSLSYCYFLPGAWPDANALPDAPTNHSVSVVPGSGHHSFRKANSGADDFVALSAATAAQFSALKSAISGATTVPNDGGAAFKAAIIAALSGFPGNIAATSLKSD